MVRGAVTSRRGKATGRVADGRFDLRGLPGSRKPYRFFEDGSDALTFGGRVLDEAPPDGRLDTFWLATPDGGRNLLSVRVRPLIDALVGLHRPEELAGVVEGAGFPVELAERLVRAGWVRRLPGTIRLDEFDVLFGGLTLSWVGGEVARQDPSSDGVLLRGGPGVGEAVEVPGWLFQHLTGSWMRPSLAEAVAFGLSDAQAWMRRVDGVLSVLPALLAGRLVSVTPVVRSAAARISMDGSRSVMRRRVGPDHDEVVSWLIIFLSKV